MDLNLMGYISFWPMAMMLVYWFKTQNTMKKKTEHL